MLEFFVVRIWLSVVTTTTSNEHVWATSSSSRQRPKWQDLRSDSNWCISRLSESNWAQPTSCWSYFQHIVKCPRRTHLLFTVGIWVGLSPTGVCRSWQQLFSQSLTIVQQQRRRTMQERDWTYYCMKQIVTQQPVHRFSSENRASTRCTHTTCFLPKNRRLFPLSIAFWNDLTQYNPKANLNHWSKT